MMGTFESSRNENFTMSRLKKLNFAGVIQAESDRRFFGSRFRFSRSLSIPEAGYSFTNIHPSKLRGMGSHFLEKKNVREQQAAVLMSLTNTFSITLIKIYRVNTCNAT